MDPIAVWGSESISWIQRYCWWTRNRSFWVSKLIIRNMSFYLYCAYNVALRWLSRGTTNYTLRYYKEVVLKVNEMELQVTLNLRKVQNQHVNFRKNCKFPHPNTKLANGAKYEPSIFEFSPILNVISKTSFLETMLNFMFEC